MVHGQTCIRNPMLKKVLLVIVFLLGLLVVGGGVAYVVTAPEKPAADSLSARWLEPGPSEVQVIETEFVDSSRATQPNNDFPGAPDRTLQASIWFPAGLNTPRPLVVYSHGFMSNRRGGLYLAEALSASGYIVVAADYPLTNGAAPGGPLVTDVANQPEDVSFLIDSVIALGVSGELPVTVDTARIGVAGLSLGGLTSTLAGFHPRWRDPRIAAVVSIAGPAFMFRTPFFATNDVPFLMIAGTVDAIVEYQANAALIPDVAPTGELVTIAEGSHVGFAHIAEPMLRALDNPDSMGCDALLSAVTDQSADAATMGNAPPFNPWAALGTPDEGIETQGEQPGLCTTVPLPSAIHPGRQHMITQLAVLGFFESEFAEGVQRSKEARELLTTHLARDFAEVTKR